MTTALAFVVAAGLGTLARLSLRARLRPVAGIPTATLAANLAGSFLLGLVAGWSAPAATVVGVAGLGSLTTFSTFADELASLPSARRRAAYGTVTLVGCVGLAWCGLRLA